MAISESELQRGGRGSAKAVKAAAIPDADEAHALNAAFSDVEVEAALNALAVKQNAVLDALRDAGIITP